MMSCKNLPLTLLAIVVSFYSLGQDLTPKKQVEARSVDLIYHGQQSFRDLNKNGSLDKYEDWRLSVGERIEDLMGQMTLEEKVGMMLINTLNAEAGGKISERAAQYIENEKMTRFIFRNTVTNNPAPGGGGRGGAQITPYEAAQFMNMIQEMAESTRLGIPIMFKSNARNHMDFDARAGINVESGAFSSWPKESGLAATRDMDLIAEFGKIMAKEWTAIGIRGMYGYMADLSTEPRWYRTHETFTEDSELASDIITSLVKNLQGEALNENSVALTIKHFPGGGPQEGGGDPHYDFGKNQAYPAKNFDYHVAPFKAAIDAGASSIMAYYGIPVDQAYQPNNVGMAFSKGILTDLLRNKLGFKGYVNSDTGIIGSRAWGLEDKSEDEQILIAIDAGTDILSGFSNNKQILDLVNSGKLSKERVDLSVRRLLKEQFELGLFEDPFVDPNRAAYLVGNASFQRKADLAQRKSIVMLQNNMNLPLTLPNGDEKLNIYAVGVNSNALTGREWTGLNVISGNDARTGAAAAGPPSQVTTVADEDLDYAILRINVSNDRSGGRMFGGASPNELDMISFSAMAESKSWTITPSLTEIREIMQKVGPEKTILSIDFRQPYVLDKESGLLDAGAIFATFGVSDEALLDVILGRFKPTGKLPYALAKDLDAIKKQNPDAPGYPKKDTLFPFGFGLTYP